VTNVATDPVSERIRASDGRSYPKDRAAHREAIRAAIEANPKQTNTAIAKRLNASRDLVIEERKRLAGVAITARYDSMCRAIAECAAVDEVKDMRDKAMALEVYARQAQNFEAERTAQEIRVRAELRAGELLKAMTKVKPSGGDRKSAEYQASRERTLDPQPGSLRSLGISRDQSSQWQQLADVPKETFEAVIADKDEPLSATRIIERHKAATQPASSPVEPVKKADKNAIHLWGELRDFAVWLEANDVTAVMEVMPPYLLEDVLRNAPLVVVHLSKIGARNE
jgi:hypothetical protein